MSGTSTGAHCVVLILRDVDEAVLIVDPKRVQVLYVKSGAQTRADVRKRTWRPPSSQRMGAWLRGRSHQDCALKQLQQPHAIYESESRARSGGVSALAAPGQASLRRRRCLPEVQRGHLDSSSWQRCRRSATSGVEQGRAHFLARYRAAACPAGTFSRIKAPTSCCPTEASEVSAECFRGLAEGTGGAQEGETWAGRPRGSAARGPERGVHRTPRRRELQATF